LFDLPAATSRASTLDYETILTWEQLDRWLEWLMAAELAAVDTETTSLDAMRAEIVGVSFSVRPARPPTCPWPIPTQVHLSNCPGMRYWHV
jgi:DNA polymerase-1